jgi:hypothetical protein
MTESQAGLDEAARLLLDGTTEGQEAALAETLQKLQGLVARQQYEAAEDLVQILGTAVGQRSRPSC